MAKKYNNVFAEYLTKEIPDYFSSKDPDLTRSPDAINNGIIDGVDDAFNDSMGDSLELELALEPALEPAPTLELAQLKTESALKPKAEILFIESNLETNNIPSSKTESTAEISQENFEAKKLTKKLIDLISANNSRARVPEKNIKNKHFQKWVNSIEKLNRLGPLGAKENENKGYSFEEINKIIEFSQQDHFWKSNILSPSKLRQKIITLENQMQRNNKAGKSAAKIDMLAELYSEAKEGEEDE